MNKTHPASKTFLAACIFCALSLLLSFVMTTAKVVKGMRTQDVPGLDFAWMYPAGQCWRQGINPYDGANYKAAIRQYTPLALGSGLSDNETTAGLIYPPNSLPIFGVLSLLTWNQALLLWCIVQLLSAYAIIILSVACIAPHWRAESKLLFIGLLAQSRLIPFVVYEAQTTFLVFACILLMVWLMMRRKPHLAGAALGFSFLKFTFPLPMIAFYAMRRQPKPIVTGLAIFALLTIAGLAPIGGIHALSAYKQAVHNWFMPGHANDTSPSNLEHRYDIDNVDLVLYNTFGNHAGLVSLLHFLLLVGVAVCIVRAGAGRVSDPKAMWLTFAAYTLFFHLFFYHRNYDAVIVFPILVLMLDCRRTGYVSRKASAAGIALCVFVVTLLPLKGLRWSVPYFLDARGPLRPFAPVEVWTLALLLVLVIWMRWQAGQASDGIAASVPALPVTPHAEAVLMMAGVN